ncbi:MAG: MAPEG family protein [Myxococcales bacterium]|nr:MAPEG family protein [Myxococcales bacterium]
MNVPLLCLPIAYALIHAPKVVFSMQLVKMPEGYDNANPRDQQAKLTGAGRRAAAAHANGFEAFAPFAAGVLACELTHARPGTAAALAVAHVIARLVYPFLYIGNVDKARSLVWTVGFLASVGLLVLPLVSP